VLCKLMEPCLCVCVCVCVCLVCEVTLMDFFAANELDRQLDQHLPGE